MILNDENRFKSTYLASGNLIGEYALIASSINAKAQKIPYVYDNENNEFLDYVDIPCNDRLNQMK